MKRSEFGILLAAGVLGSCSHAAPLRSRIQIALNGEPSTLNLLLGDDPYTFHVGMIINSFLLRSNESGNLISDLAVRVPTLANGGISHDGRTLRYELRPNAYWHDDTPVTAQDVAFTLELIDRSDVNIADRSGYDLISDYRVVSPTVIDIRLREPYSPGVATFLCTAANQPYPVVPRHLLAGVRDINHASFNERPIGCGPYAVKQWVRDEAVMLQRYDRYFRGLPPTPYIAMRPASSMQALVGLWQDRAIDVAWLIGERALLDEFRQLPEVEVTISKRNTIQYLLFQHQRAPLGDERVRRGIAAAIDRDRILRDVLGPLYVPAGGDRLPDAFGYDATARQQTYDPTLAERLLAPYRPLELTLVSSTFPYLRQIAVLIQEALSRVGVTVTVRAYVPSVLFAPSEDGGILSGGHFDLFLGIWSPGGVADTSYLYRCDTRPPNGENYGRICDPIVDRAAHQELTAVQPALQSAGDIAMQQELIAQTQLIFLGFVAEAFITRRGIVGFKPSTINRDLWNPWEWHWRQQEKKSALSCALQMVLARP